MVKIPSRSLHPLDQAWPSFLGRLDSDPRAAFGEFYAFAWKLLRSHPPSALRGLLPPDRDEVISEVILHCWQNDRRVLRTYRDRGIPFSRWFLMVARCKALDHIRSSDCRPAAGAGGHRPPLDPNGGPPIDPGPLPDDRMIARQNLESVHRCILQMGENCQLLLLGSAQGLKPRELTRLLGWPRDWGKKASDSLRYCRSRLKELLRQGGIDWRDMTGRKPEPEKVAR